MAQRLGPVSLAIADTEEECTIVPVPTETVGFVTGKGGNFLRTVEEEHGVIMLFAAVEGSEKDAADGDYEHLVIFGHLRGRRGAQLTIMHVVEQKVPEYYTYASKESGETYEQEQDKVGDWGTSIAELKGDELSYAVGKKGMTRKKIAWASGCIVQYVNGVVFFSGTEAERGR